MQIGWIGLGNMGSVMAARVLDAGHDLTVYNRNREKATALAERGARPAETPDGAARNAEILVTMLADDTALADVLERGGALGALPPGAVHVSMSTISHELAQRLTSSHAERGVALVGAPVFGRPDAAAAGKLFILAAGEATALERCQPLFELLSQKVLPLGTAPAAAHLCKVLGNFMLISSVELLAEALNVAHKTELAPEALLSALTSSVFSAPFYANYGKLMLAQRFDGPPGFALPLAKKDLSLALSAARQNGAALPVAETVRAKVQQLIADGGSDLDLTAIGRYTPRG
ncbi:MAG TPA: NAD(P)-dependent oxidoreductase [Polyangiaceae bacterium]|nr:NAD(P)-dependent oxidoreductase [Polyangiaceae bacterium]